MIKRIDGVEKFVEMFAKKYDLNSIVNQQVNIKLLVEVKNANPNGDADQRGEPRVVNGMGIITDVAQKRRIRMAIASLFPECGILEQDDTIICDEDIKYYDNKTKKFDVLGFCKKFWDVKCFGHLINVPGLSKGITGPLQFSMGETVCPVNSINYAITRTAAAKMVKKGKHKYNEPVDDSENNDRETGKRGNKRLIEHGLYTSLATLIPCMAEKTGMTYNDLLMVVKSLPYMWELNHSSNTGLITVRGAYVVFHNSEFGKMQRGQVNESIVVKSNVEEPASYTDYSTVIDEEKFAKKNMDVFYIEF